MSKRRKKLISNRKTGILLVVLAITNLIGIGFSSWILPSEKTESSIDNIKANVSGIVSNALTLNSITFSTIGLDGFYNDLNERSNNFVIKVDFSIALNDIYSALGECDIRLTLGLTCLNVSDFLTSIVKHTDSSSKIAILNSISNTTSNYLLINNTPTFEFTFKNIVKSDSTTSGGVATMSFKYTGTIDEFESDVYDKTNDSNLTIECDVKLGGGKYEN